MENIGGLLLPLFMFGALYFIVIRPMTKKQREQQEMIKRLAVGDQVVTRGGVIARIANVEDHVFTLDVDGKTKIRVLRTYIEGRYEPSVNASGIIDKPLEQRTSLPS